MANFGLDWSRFIYPSSDLSIREEITIPSFTLLPNFGILKSTYFRFNTVELCPLSEEFEALLGCNLDSAYPLALDGSNIQFFASVICSLDSQFRDRVKVLSRISC